jgi:hypothetical protein
MIGLGFVILVIVKVFITSLTLLILLLIVLFTILINISVSLLYLFHFVSISIDAVQDYKAGHSGIKIAVLFEKGFAVVCQLGYRVFRKIDFFEVLECEERCERL